MKTRTKYSLNFFMVLVAIFAIGCGKTNKVSSSGSSPFTSGASNIDAGVVNQVQAVKSKIACKVGDPRFPNVGPRLQNDVSFFTQARVYGNTINGNWQPGFSSSGYVNKVWIGVSSFGDIMFVSQVVNGSQVVGFNVTLSFCEYKNLANPSTEYSIISDMKQFTNFYTQNGITLSSSPLCGYNVVTSASNTSVDVSNGGNYNGGYYGGGYGTQKIQTSFAQPGCSGY